MTGLQWLRLDKTNLTDIPEELGKLMKLVCLCLIYPLLLIHLKNRHERIHFFLKLFKVQIVIYELFLLCNKTK